jgi:hypothetical protein
LGHEEAEDGDQQVHHDGQLALPVLGQQRGERFQADVAASRTPTATARDVMYSTSSSASASAQVGVSLRT